MTIETGVFILLVIVISMLLLIFVSLSEIRKFLEGMDRRLKSCSIDVVKILALKDGEKK